MKIAILGGSFDPPHIGHYLVARQIVELTAIEQVWLVPCHTHPFNKEMSAASHRLAMTTMLENDVIKVCDYEATKHEVSYSIDTLTALSEIHKNDQFSWIIGSDQVEDFHKWKRGQEIIDNFGLIVFPRGTEKQNFSALPSSLQVIDNDTMILTSISSTAIRQRVKKKQPLTHLVPSEIETYIKNNKLYL